MDGERTPRLGGQDRRWEVAGYGGETEESMDGRGAGIEGKGEN